MRLFLVFIIILNLLYAGWEYLSPAVSNEEIAPLADNLQTLELLRETRQQQGVVLDIDIGPGVENSHDAETLELSTEVQELQEVESEAACYTLGPFKDKDIMQQLRISLAEHVDDLKVRKLQDSEKHRYWVYIPALKNRRQARKMVEKLRASQITDFYIILNGDARNGISLGHFKEQKHANRRLRQVTSLGYDAEINVIYREFDVYWLDYQNNVVKEDEGFSIDEYATEGVSQLERECN